MAGIFKAYDVRGTYPDQIDEATARKIGQAFAHLVADDPGPIVVSRDMRSHSEPLCEALIDGLRTAGLDVVDEGLVAAREASWRGTGGRHDRLALEHHQVAGRQQQIQRPVKVAEVTDDLLEGFQCIHAQQPASRVCVEMGVCQLKNA